MFQRDPSSSRTWREKFANAFRGMAYAFCTETSFYVHLVAAAAVIVAAAGLQVSLAQWCLLIGCIAAVLLAEMINTALEYLAQAITDHEDQRIGAALDIGSAAVLLASMAAAVVGLLVLGHRLGERLGWW